MVQLIDEHKPVYGVEVIYRVLPIVLSKYYCEKHFSVNPHERSMHNQYDDFYLNEIRRLWTDSKHHYGFRKVWQ